MDASQAFAALYRDYLRPMTPGPIILELLGASFDPEVQAPRLAEIVERDPIYSHYLQKIDILQAKVQQWREDFPEEKGTERLTRFIVVLLGSAAVRNAVMAVWINRHAGQGLPTKEGVPFLVLPKVYLKYAMTVLEYCDEYKIPHVDTAYSGALCFDWVAALMDKKGGTVKSEKRYLDELWPNAVMTARIAHELAASARRMTLSSYAFSSALLIELGKVLMAASFQKTESGAGWKEFVRHCESHGQSADAARVVLEKRKFAWTHSEAAALCAMIFPQLAPSASAIEFYLEPYFLRKSESDSYELALILSVATQLARTKAVASLNPEWKKDLAKLGIEDAQIQNALNRAVGSKDRKGK